jgi:hypothetical protein
MRVASVLALLLPVVMITVLGARVVHAAHLEQPEAAAVQDAGAAMVHHHTLRARSAGG